MANSITVTIPSSAFNFTSFDASEWRLDAGSYISLGSDLSADGNPLYLRLLRVVYNDSAAGSRGSVTIELESSQVEDLSQTTSNSFTEEMEMLGVVELTNIANGVSVIVPLASDVSGSEPYYLEPESELAADVHDWAVTVGFINLDQTITATFSFVPLPVVIEPPPLAVYREQVLAPFQTITRGWYQQQYVENIRSLAGVFSPINQYLLALSNLDGIGYHGKVLTNQHLLLGNAPGNAVIFPPADGDEPHILAVLNGEIQWVNSTVFFLSNDRMLSLTG